MRSPVVVISSWSAFERSSARVEPALEHVAPLRVRLGLLEEELGHRLVDQDAREPLGVQHREGEVALRVPVLVSASRHSPTGTSASVLSLPAAVRVSEVLLRRHRERLQLGDAPLERIARRDRPPARLPHARRRTPAAA